MARLLETKLPTIAWQSPAPPDTDLWSVNLSQPKTCQTAGANYVPVTWHSGYFVPAKDDFGSETGHGQRDFDRTVSKPSMATGPRTCRFRLSKGAGQPATVAN